MEQSCHSQCRVFVCVFFFCLHWFYDVRNLLSWPKGSGEQWKQWSSQSRDMLPLSSARAQHFPCSLGLEKFQLFLFIFLGIFSHIHREGNVAQRGGGSWELGFPGNASHLLCSSRPTLTCLTYLFIYALIQHTFRAPPVFQALETPQEARLILSALMEFIF